MVHLSCVFKGSHQLLEGGAPEGQSLPEGILGVNGCRGGRAVFFFSDVIIKVFLPYK